MSAELQIVKLENENAQLHALLYTLINDLGGAVLFNKSSYLDPLLAGRRVTILESNDEIEVVCTYEVEVICEG